MDIGGAAIVKIIIKLYFDLQLHVYDVVSCKTNSKYLKKCICYV